MAFDSEQLAQLQALRRDIREDISEDAVGIVESALTPLRRQLAKIEDRIERIFEAETQDIGVAYKEIESLKKEVQLLKRRIAALEQ